MSLQNFFSSTAIQLQPVTHQIPTIPYLYTIIIRDEVLRQVLDIGPQLGVLPDAQEMARVRGQWVPNALVVIKP